MKYNAATSKSQMCSQALNSLTQSHVWEPGIEEAHYYSRYFLLLSEKSEDLVLQWDLYPQGHNNLPVALWNITEPGNRL